jgi:hypothetical protein
MKAENYYYICYKKTEILHFEIKIIIISSKEHFLKVKVLYIHVGCVYTVYYIIIMQWQFCDKMQKINKSAICCKTARDCITVFLKLCNFMNFYLVNVLNRSAHVKFYFHYGKMIQNFQLSRKKWMYWWNKRRFRSLVSFIVYLVHF